MVKQLAVELSRSDWALVLQSLRIRRNNVPNDLAESLIGLYETIANQIPPVKN